MKLSPAEATLGCEKTLDIPILGKKTITVKHGTQGEDVFRFANEGAPRLDRKGMK